MQSTTPDGPPPRRLRLQHRIVLPFAIVAVVATAVAAVVTLSVSSDVLRTRMQAQLVSAAGFVSRSDLALNRLVLENVREITGAEVLTFGPDGELAATTADDQGRRLAATIRPHLASLPSTGGTPVPIWTRCDAPCLVVLSRLQTRPQYVVALVTGTEDVTAASASVTRAALLAALLSVLVMVLVSQLVVRRMIAPLERLVSFVRGVSPNDRAARAQVGDDEVGTLAEAFNGMLDRLQQSQSALVRSEKLALAGLFAARVAHDIRNPLSSIKMQTQLLRGQLNEATDRETLAAVLRDIDQVESVIRDLLELARPGELRLEPSSVNDVISEALRHLGPQFSHRKIAVDTRLDDALPLQPLDRERLKQAFLNVLVNASEAMPHGGSVRVTSTYHHTHALLEICDSGTGVDPAVAMRVFEPFVSTKRDGVGLGLVNVRAVIEGHGGSIELRPGEPRGTCVVVRLPFTPAPANAQPATHHG